MRIKNIAYLIEHAIVSRSADILSGHEAKHTQSVLDRDEDNVLIKDVIRLIIGRGSSDEVASVNPNDDWPPFFHHQIPRVDVEPKTIFLANPNVWFVIHMLGTNVAVPFGITDALPCWSRYRRLPSKSSNWRLYMFDSSECQDPFLASGLLDGAPEHALFGLSHWKLPDVGLNLDLTFFMFTVFTFFHCF